MSNPCIQFGMERILYCYMVDEQHTADSGKVRIVPRFFGDYQVFFLGIRMRDGLRECGRKELLQWLREACGEANKAFRHLCRQEWDYDSLVPEYLVYDPPFERWLRKMGCLGWWKGIMGVEEFTFFSRTGHLSFLLQHIPDWRECRQILWLGCPKEAGALFASVAENAGQMRVYTLEERSVFEEYAEEVKEEFGLVVEVEPWRKHGLKSEKPTLVIDFLPDRVSGIGLCEGSIWVDMNANEGKRYYLENGEGKLRYFSLKTIWMAEMQQTLDTISKIQYNTEVKWE